MRPRDSLLEALALFRDLNPTITVNEIITFLYTCENEGLSVQELAYVPRIGGGGADLSLAEPGLGFTNVLEGHPFAETPYYDNASKSWVYGATYERRPNVAYSGAGFLFTNPK